MDKRLHGGDVVQHRGSGRIGRVTRFAHDGTTDFMDGETGPYKQDDFIRLVPEKEPDRRPKVGVGIFVRRPDGAILMGLRKGSHGAGTWWLPGGLVEADEDLIDATEREMHEETGLTPYVEIVPGPCPLRVLYAAPTCLR